MPPIEPSAAPDPWIGRVIDNRYRVMECIGRGGMGTVYKVVHAHMGKVAAMKLLHGSLAQDKELIKRFHQEATAISKLNHPNIVQVFDFGRVERSMYLVMEYLKGEDLSLILRRDGPMDPRRALVVLVQICNALVEAHEAGIIHRDLKPENVRISRTRDGRDFIKVLDFGLAKMLVEHDDEPRPQDDGPITARGSLVGTPYYMAPEMIRAKPLDHRVDIYSVGAMAYRMLTAQNAFSAKTPMAVLTKHITEQVEPPSRRMPELSIPPELDTVVLRAMAKNPDQRYQDAAELKGDLLDVMARLQVPDTSDPYVDPALARATPASWPRPPVDVTGPVSIGGEAAAPRLSKEDLAFERKLRRGRVWTFLIPLLLLGSVAFAVYWFVLKPVEQLPTTAEVEPNNGPGQATPLLPGKPLTGQIGRRLSNRESDRDWYRVQVTGQGPQALQARVSGIPNMDIVLELFDGAAGGMTKADSAAKGGDETIARWVVDPGPYYLMVREVWVQGVAPTENVTDKYRVQVRWMPAGEGWEQEPNDQPDKAQELTLGQTINGYLAPVGDVDIYRVTPQKGRLYGLVTGVQGVDLTLQLQREKARSKPLVVNKAPVSAGEAFEKFKVSGKNPVLIRVTRVNTAKAEPPLEPPGIDLPYTIKVWQEK